MVRRWVQGVILALVLLGLILHTAVNAVKETTETLFVWNEKVHSRIARNIRENISNKLGPNERTPRPVSLLVMKVFRTQNAHLAHRTFS